MLIYDFKSGKEKENKVWVNDQLCGTIGPEKKGDYYILMKCDAIVEGDYIYSDSDYKVHEVYGQPDECESDKYINEFISQTSFTLQYEQNIIVKDKYDQISL